MRFLAFAFLASLAANAASIKSDMQDIGTLFKQIGTSVNDAAKNQANAQACAQMVTLFQDAQGQVPDAIHDMPSSQQAAAVADYQQMIGEEIADAQKLEAAFQNNDNASASKIYLDMSNIKRDGHDKYNP